MNTTSNNSPPRIRQVLKWTLGLPVALLIVITIGIAARYVSSKAHLDRLKPEREQWIFNKKVTIEFEQVVPGWIRKLIGQNRCEPLDRMKAIHFRDVTDDDLIKWQGCYDTQSVTILCKVPITDRGLSQLGELRLLESLEISGGRFTSKGIRGLSKCPHLTSARFGNVEVSADWCDAVPQLHNLQELEVEKLDLAPVTMYEVKAAAALSKLRTVRLNHSTWNNGGGPTTPLGSSPIGRTWYIAVEDLTEEFTKPLADLPDLDSLELFCGSMSSDSLRILARSPSLRRLQIRTGEITEAHLMMFKECRKLEFLALSGFDESDGLNDHGLSHLAALPSLTDLMLYGSFSQRDLSGLAQVTRLQALRIENFYGSGLRGIDRLKSLVNLEEFDLHDNFAAATDLDIILSMPKLHWLRFETEASLPNHLHVLAEHMKLPVALKVGFPTALRSLEAQARDPKSKDYPIGLSIGHRKRLPEEWQQGPGID